LIVVDNFAGGGGASTGIEAALGRHCDFAINHDAEALAMHAANHPRTVHLQTNVWDVNPRKLCRGKPVSLGWFSPDCTFHSKARGGKPFRDRDTARRRRGLAWLIPYWMKAVRPRVVLLENVEEFADWGPLLPDGTICPKRRGMTFRRWHRMIENLGYSIDMRELRACDYGAPTIRKRLFVIARCDGGEIVFPEAMHGPGLAPYRTAADCIDWSIPCPSIFDRERPLAEATMRRIARGVMRYAVHNPKPFIQHASNKYALITPFLTEHANSSNQRNFPADEPMRTQCANVKGGRFAVVAPTLINTRNGEREGQQPRCRDIESPYPTVTAAGSQGAVVAAFLARHYGGHENDGSMIERPFHTVTTKDHHALVSSHILKLKGTSQDGQPIDAPLHTVQAGGQHYGEVRAFLLKYYGNEQNTHSIREPIGAVTTKDRFGLVTVRGEPYAIVDIGMRMLTPRELFRAQGFHDGYVIDPEFDGKPLTKTSQVRMVGNSVCPPVAEALVRANVVDQQRVAA